MDNKPVLIITLTFLMAGFTLKSFAESTLTIEDRAKLGEVYSFERLKQYPKALPLIEVLYQRYGKDREVRWTYVRVMGFGGHWKEAMKAFGGLCAVKCDEEMFVTYAHILEAQGPDPETLIYIKRLADQHPDQKDIQSIYSEILSWNVQNPRGRHIIEELGIDYPNDLKVMEAMGDIAYSKKDYALAQKDYENILRERPALSVYKKYVGTLEGQKKYADAITQMDNLLSHHPNDQVLRYQHAQVVSAAGDHQRAVKELQALLDDGFTNKEAVIMLGDELRLLGRYEESLKVYQGVINEK